MAQADTKNTAAPQTEAELDAYLARKLKLEIRSRRVREGDSLFDISIGLKLGEKTVSAVTFTV